METQGWPLWAVSQSTGQVWAVIGWQSAPASGSNVAPMLAYGVEIGPEVEGSPAVALGGPVRFFTDHEAVLRVTR